MNPKEITAIQDAVEDTRVALKAIKKGAAKSDTKAYPKLVRAMLSTLAEVKRVIPNEVFAKSVAKDVHKQGYNHLRSIQQFEKEEGWIEHEMMEAFHSEFKPLFKGLSKWASDLTVREKKKQDEEAEAKKLAENIITESAKFSKALPKPKKTTAIVQLPIVAPFSRFFANEVVFKKLGITHSYLGDGNNSDYVILNDQFVLAIQGKHYKEHGEEAVTKALAALTEQLGVEIVLVEETPVRQKACTSHMFFWVMEAPRVDHLRGNIKFGDLDWGLAL